MVSFMGGHFETDIILTCVRWYVAYPLSYRQRGELMQERGVAKGKRPSTRAYRSGGSLGLRLQ
jgi:transposase-like protein